MRIGILADSYMPYMSGVSTSIHILAEGLIEEGHEVFIITPKYKGYKVYDKDYDYIKRVSGGIVLPKKGVRFLKYIPFVGRYVRKLKKLNLDIIHFHTELSTGKLAIKARRRLGIPLVYTVHTMYEEYLHFVSKKLAKTFRKPMMRIVKRIMRKHILNSNEIIVPSQKIKDLMLSYNINREYNIVPTGIHLDVFKEESHKKEDVLNLRKELGLKEDDFVCLFVGRVSLEKGIDKLIDGFKEINKDDIKFVIIGGGPHFKDIKERVEKEGLKDKIIFTGIVPWEDIGLYYQLGDVFLNASISETQGLTYIEALASGQPLIVKYDKVLENVVIDGENGLFFHEVPELTENILKLYNDKELYNKIKANTLKSVLKYEDKVFVKNVLEVYKKAINQ